MKTLFALLALSLLCSWQPPSKSRLKQMQWLCGSWIHHSKRGPVYECWTRISNTELSGKSFALKGADTMMLESIRIVSEKAQLYYIPTVAGQNKGLPVRFTATAIAAQTLVFENPAHDFPQHIAYTLIGPDSLLAEISGTRNGQVQQRLFPMKRVN